MQVRKSVVERAAFRARAAGAAKTCHLLAGTTTISKGLAGRLVANGAPLGVPGKPFIAPPVNSTQRRRLQQAVAEPTSVNLANGYNVFIGKQRSLSAALYQSTNTLLVLNPPHYILSPDEPGPG